MTELSNLSRAYVEEKTVLGIASFDNYEESTQYEDDADAAAISAAVRTPCFARASVICFVETEPNTLPSTPVLTVKLRIIFSIFTH